MTDRVETVSLYLQSDHRRLDSLMERCRQLVDEGDLSRAAEVFGSFREGLIRHIRIEEEMLFPEFEEATGMARSSGPTGVMLSEHVEIKRLLEEIQGIFESAPTAREAFEPLRSALCALLSEHNAKEERILYPISDQTIAPDRLSRLVRMMKAF